MALSPRDEFRTLLRSLGREAFADFVADFWAVRGCETVRSTVRFIMTNPATGDKEVLGVVPAGRFRRPSTPAHADVDVVVYAGLGPSRSVEPAVRVIDADELGQIALYVANRAAVSRLFQQYFGRNRASTSRRVRTLRVGRAAVGSGSSSTRPYGRAGGPGRQGRGVPPARSAPVRPVNRPSSSALPGMPAPGIDDGRPPGLEANGVMNASALLSAHVEAFAGQFYTQLPEQSW